MSESWEAPSTLRRELPPGTSLPPTGTQLSEACGAHVTLNTLASWASASLPIEERLQSVRLHAQGLA